MKIYSMTATFGKLHHDTLRFTDGLNIMQAPNEWGKSTWCAFLTAMLYGIDTRQQTTKAGLADKERFMPWSGEPMSGRMELSWNGRDITIERSSKGRIPFGEFRAYETATGLDVPELTASNCGSQLLGVEKAVFTRAGFIRLSDMPVTQDENLRRRLNSLVTTGDESGAGDTLGKQLKDLKNKVRYNRSGLLPQAEYEKEQLRYQLEQHQDLQSQIQQITLRQSVLEQELKELENHSDALRYESARENTARIQIARDTCQQLQAELDNLEALCDPFPDEETAQHALEQGKSLQAQQYELRLRQPSAPPTAPEIPAQYHGVTPEQAVANAQADTDAYSNSEKKVRHGAMIPMLLGVGTMLLLGVLIAVSIATGFMTLLYFAGPVLLLLCAVGIALSVAHVKKARDHMDAIAQRHPGIPLHAWVWDAQKYSDTQGAYQLALQQFQLANREAVDAQEAFSRQLQAYTGDKTLEQALEYWANVLQSREQLTAKRRELKNAAEHANALQAVASMPPQPAFPDTLTCNAQETEGKLQQGRFEQKQLQIRLGQCMGQAEALGPQEVLKARLDSVSHRITRLEDYYRALELSQEVLYQASSALQRRFAPRISKRAQDYFTRLTGGRYQRISLSDDLTISASAENEDILRGSQWRSDGTVDQLYLSLRLAVANELTPNSPLILDDALVRFDDTRLKVALDVLKEEATQKQVILFTCQSREKHLL